MIYQNGSDKMVKKCMFSIKSCCLLLTFVYLNTFGQTPVLNSVGISKFSLNSVGFHINKEWEKVLIDTVFDEESYYYSTVFEIGKTVDAEKKIVVYLINTYYTGQDKGENADLPIRNYLLKSGKNLYYCGNREKKNGLGGASPIFKSLSNRINCEMQPQSNVILKELEILPEIKRADKKVLYWVPSEVMIGTPDNTMLIELFNVDSVGPVYMTDVKKSFLSDNPLEFKNKKLNTWINSCRDHNCFETDRFFLFRIDGTYLLYDVKPPIVKNNVTCVNKDHTVGFPEYTTKTLTTCEARSVADVTPLSPTFLKRNPVSFCGVISSTKDSFWIFQDSAPVLKDAYAIIKDAKAYWEEICGNVNTVPDFPEFIKNVPLLVWKDPFGRQILYKTKELNPPACCEPVFYLYSTTDANVKINFSIPGIVRNSKPPEDDNGWNIHISENRMQHGVLKESIPYVFWEGWIGALPKPQTGFFVTANKLENLFDENLKIMGLNDHEISDFKNLWLIKCPKAPFYMVHFYNTDFVNQYCPLSIVPEPQTSIRIYIDVEPCFNVRNIEKQEIKPQTNRTGLTYVEWGAVIRESENESEY
jgi:hypothetical protein